MNKKIRNLIIGAVILIVLVGALLLLKFLPSNSGGEESSVTSYSSTSVELFKREASEVSSLEIQNEAGGFTIVRKAEGLYNIEALNNFEQTTSSYSSLISTFASISAMRMVEEAPEDLAKYGLSNPKTTVIVNYDDNTKNVLHIGDVLPTGDGRYFMYNDEKPVYTMGTTTSASLENTILNYVGTTVVPAWTAPAPENSDSSATPKTAPDITYLNIVGGSLTEKMGETPLTIEMGETNKEMEDLGMSGSTWRITSPVGADLHTENSSAMMQAIQNGMTATSVAAISPTAEDLASFGLDAPYAKVDFTRDEESFTLTIGNAINGSSHYVMVNGKEVVYVVDDASLPFLSININKMFSALTILPYIDKVGEVEVTIGGKTYRFLMEGEGDELKTTCDGKTLDADGYRKFYQFLLSAPAEEINFDKETGEVVASILYRYRNSTKTDKVEFLKVSDRRCVLSLNGEQAFITRMAYVDKLQQNCDKILNGEMPDVDW